MSLDNISSVFGSAEQIFTLRTNSESLRPLNSLLNHIYVKGWVYGPFSALLIAAVTYVVYLRLLQSIKVHPEGGRGQNHEAPLTVHSGALVVQLMWGPLKLLRKSK